MFEVRIHGRGGQGVVTTAELLSIAGGLQPAHHRSGQVRRVNCWDSGGQP
jgi:Pyruvate/2-oxoacid:ferredoxin oxidoreductase gamma subunit